MTSAFPPLPPSVGAPPTAEMIGAALAALGAYPGAPSGRDLAAQAGLMGGEPVLAAVLANALYGVAIGTAMVSEDRMLATGGDPGRLAVARGQVLAASGATGPDVLGVLRFQATQVAGPLRGWDHDCDVGPVGRAAADAARAVVLLLQACTVTTTTDPAYPGLPATLAEAAMTLTDALAHVHHALATPDTLAGSLFPQDHPRA